MLVFSQFHRLRHKQDFQFVFAKPSKTIHKYLLALYRTNALDHARLGIIVNKSHVKRAPDRNRIKRVIRESFRHHQQVLKGLDIIVLIRSECDTLDKKTLRDNIDTLWQKVMHSSTP